MGRRPRFLTAQAAARELGVSRATLYAYVSRGLIRSEADPDDRRARRYHAEDVRRLKARTAERRDPARAARRALRLGDPVLESAITLIDGERFHYRGHDAVELAATRTLEEVASLVWTGAPGPLRSWVSVHAPDAPFDPAHPIESFQRILIDAAAADASAYDLSAAGTAHAGARILRLLVAAVAGRDDVERAADALAARWCPGRPHARRLLDAALILCVDHELNASAFTARCAASARATPYEAVVAGFAALGGTRQSGGEVERVEALFDEVDEPGHAAEVLRRRLRRGEGVPGFGHPLYPEGDPRGAALLRVLRQHEPGAPPLTRAEAIASAARELLGEGPVVDFGLVALARVLALPARSALALFALGRSVGLVAHAIEQYASPGVIRPRARYVGPPPGG